MSKKKLAQKMLSLNQQWWKKRDDPVVLKKFMECCWEIGQRSVEVSESGFLMLHEWINSFGGIYTRIHRYHVRINTDADVIDLKLNYLDFEYYALVNDKFEKMFNNVQDVKPWLISRFPFFDDSTQ
ncbi:hypothetical protein HGO21_03270 [Acinetobacter sp. CUI P1]|nr:hypothetical protein [Acinetobacter sp. CUI P1]